MVPLFAHAPVGGAATLGWHDWTLDPVVLTGLVALVVLYHTFPRIRPTPRQVACFWGGVVALMVALLSPLDFGAAYLFWLHMVQHLLLMLIAAPLLALALPPAFLGWLTHRAILRPLMRVLWNPWLAFFLYNAAVVLWHLPPCYEATLRDRAVHAAEHLTFLLTAMAFWGVILSPGGVPPYGLRVALLLGSAVVQFVPAFVIALADRVLYPTYAAAPRLWRWSPLDDQRFGGALMWVTMNLAYVVAILRFVGPLLQPERSLNPESNRGAGIDRSPS
jgi:cytochrome c oxidase assembly factor CtaG